MLNRRDLLTALAPAVAASIALPRTLAAADAVVASVADRTSSIRITKLTATPMQRKVYLKIETNHGVTGWGEIDQLEPYVAALLARSLFELLNGENPTRIEFLWQKIYRSHRDMRGGPFMTHTLAGIDMALWDIAGKLWGVPMYRLLGGPTRDKVRVYPSATATKVGTAPEEFSGTPADMERHVRNIANARKQVGPAGMVMFDAHCALPPPFLIQLAGAIQPYDVTYIEEPAVPGNIEVFKRIKQHVKIPLAIGEQARTIWDVIPYLQERVGDFLQVDMAHTGGPSQLHEDRDARRGLPRAHCAALRHDRPRHVGEPARLRVRAALPHPRVLPEHHAEGFDSENLGGGQGRQRLAAHRRRPRLRSERGAARRTRSSPRSPSGPRAAGSRTAPSRTIELNQLNRLG